MASGLVPLLNPSVTIPPKEPDLGIDPIAIDPIPDPAPIPYVQSLVSDTPLITLTPEGPSVGEDPNSQGNLVIDATITGGEAPSIWLDIDSYLLNAGANWNASLTTNWYLELTGSGTRTMPDPIGLPDGFMFAVNILKRSGSKTIAFGNKWRFPDGVVGGDWIMFNNTQHIISCVWLASSAMTKLGGEWTQLNAGAVFASQPTMYQYLKA